MEAATTTPLFLLSEDNASFLSSLYRRYKKAVFLHVYMIIRNVDLARDITEDAFIKVAQALQKGKYNDQGTDGAWIMRIARNLCIDHFRKKKKLPMRISILDFEDPVVTIPSKTLDWQQKIQNVEIEEVIRALIDRLPPEQRDVVIMRHFLGMSFKEIASCTEVSINTSLGRMRYALRNLRRIIKKHDVSLDGYVVASD